jgi:hypothetical protein
MEVTEAPEKVVTEGAGAVCRKELVSLQHVARRVRSGCRGRRGETSAYLCPRR